MNRKPIFDAVRKMIGGHFTPQQVQDLDLACDLAEAAPGLPEVRPTAPDRSPAPDTPRDPAAPSLTRTHKLGDLSRKYESGTGGPGTVSSGSGDPGGVSYGSYQLSSAAGTLTAFMKAEGKPWATRFGTATGGTPAFSTVWKQVASDEPAAFDDAQHAFIERTHYRPAVAEVIAARHLDLDSRHDAVRDATWSISVQHARATTILVDAVSACDVACARTDPGYDRKLIEALYKRRTDYVLGVAANPKLSSAQKDQLISITRHRYVEELADALKMMDADTAPPPSPAPASSPSEPSNSSIDGNIVAAQNGVSVKSAAVKLKQLHPRMERVIVAVAQVAKALDLPKPVITSGNDSKHMNGSLHYQWRALDFRGNNVTVAVGQKFAHDVAAALGHEYDVAFETFVNASNNHLHVEYDPD